MLAERCGPPPGKPSNRALFFKNYAGLTLAEVRQRLASVEASVKKRKKLSMNEQWELIEPLLRKPRPSCAKRGRPPVSNGISLHTMDSANGTLISGGMR